MDKYGFDRKVEFDLVFGELCHYLIILERVPQNCGGLIYSGRTQIILPHNKGLVLFNKNLPHLVG